MLRIIVDTRDKSYSEDFKDINIQRTSFENICSSSENIESFRKFIEQYVKMKDEVVILTIDSKMSNAFSIFSKLFNSERIRVINTSLPMGGMRIVIRTIFSNKDKSLDAIEKGVVKISEILNTTYFILSEYNL
jgi:fatty acid-binding protein DegV